MELPPSRKLTITIGKCGINAEDNHGIGTGGDGGGGNGYNAGGGGGGTWITTYNPATFPRPDYFQPLAIGGGGGGASERSFGGSGGKTGDDGWPSGNGYPVATQKGGYGGTKDGGGKPGYVFYPNSKWTKVKGYWWQCPIWPCPKPTSGQMVYGGDGGFQAQGGGGGGYYGGGAGGTWGGGGGGSSYGGQTVQKNGQVHGTFSGDGYVYLFY